jgi:hypothetical protein
MSLSSPLSYVVAAYAAVFIPLIVLRISTARQSMRLRREMEMMHED